MFQVSGDNFSAAANILSIQIKQYLSTNVMVTVPTSVIVNPLKWQNNFMLKAMLEYAFESSFKKENTADRKYFAYTLAEKINTWFMVPINQAVVSITLPGPIVVPGPAVPNRENTNVKVLESSLKQITTRIDELSKKEAARLYNAAIEKYFNGFKTGKQAVWTLGGASGYLT